jgi:hypothetical protein
MSGSSGGGGGGGDYQPTRDCSGLVLDTQLSSPKAAVVSQINKGDVLQVEALTQGATTTVVVKHQGKVAGGLASSEINQLRECLAKGHKYKAKVLEKKGGQVRVLVQAA